MDHESILLNEDWFPTIFASYLNKTAFKSFHHISRSSVSLTFHRIREVLAGMSSCPTCCSSWQLLLIPDQDNPGSVQMSLGNLWGGRLNHFCGQPLPVLLWLLQREVPSYCSTPNHNLCHYIPHFTICLYWIQITFNIFVNVFQEVSGCYWIVL